MVQATDEVIERPDSTPLSPDDAVVVSRDDENLISTEDEVVIMPEGGNLISPPLENLTVSEEQEIEHIKPEDDTTIGITEAEDDENYQPLIAPLTQTEDETPVVVGVAVLLVALGAIAVIFIVAGKKKQNK